MAERKLQYWAIGMGIGAIVWLIFLAYAILSGSYSDCRQLDLTSPAMNTQPPVCNLLFFNQYNGRLTNIAFFMIIGALVGWIIGKVKSNRENKK